MNSNYPADRKFLIRGIPANKVKEVLEHIQDHLGGIIVDRLFRERATVKEMVGWISKWVAEEFIVEFGAPGRGDTVGPYVTVSVAGVQWGNTKYLEFQYSPEIFPQFDWEYNDG